MSEPFRFRLRVRYAECDPQGIVFNARWGDYVDVACTEYTRAIFGAIAAEDIGFDWRLVRQLKEWKAPARFDDVIEARVRTVRIGTTSFTIGTEFHRHPDGLLLATAETVYVVVDSKDYKKTPIPASQRAALEQGASGRLVDHAGSTSSPSPSSSAVL